MRDVKEQPPKADRQPLACCVHCGGDTRSRARLCRNCLHGDERRSAAYTQRDDPRWTLKALLVR
jgi:hypothetical protein